MARGQHLRGKLITYQIPLGLFGIVLGLWCLVLNFMHP